MGILSYILAVVFSLVGVGASWFGWPRWVGICAILLAALFLILGLYNSYTKREIPPAELDEEQRATIRKMKSEGNTGMAIRQVQLWFRQIDPQEAARLVREA